MAHDPGVFRAPMGAGRGEASAAVERALSAAVCGLPGLLRPPPVDLDETLAEVSDTYGERAAARLGRFARVPDGAFVWTRSVDGYVLGRLAGPWFYDTSAEAQDVDLVHVRPCRWLPDPTPEAQVPAGTLRTFARGGRNFQQTHDPAITEQTRSIWDGSPHQACTPEVSRRRRSPAPPWSCSNGP